MIPCIVNCLAFRALRSHLFQLCIWSFCKQCKIKTKQNFLDLKNKITGFLKISKKYFVWGKFLKIWSSIKPYVGSREVPQKIWVRLVQPFWYVLIQTDRQAYIEIYNLLIKNIKVLIINIFFTYYRNILFREIILLKIHKFFSSKLFNFIPASFIVLKLQLDIFLYN